MADVFPPTDLLPSAHWAALKLHVRWAYCGPPRIGQVEGRHNDGYSAWLIQAGTVRFALNRMPGAAVAGDWVLLPPGSLAFEFSPDARILSVHYDAHWPDGSPLFHYRHPVRMGHGEFPYLLPAAEALERYARRHLPAEAFSQANAALSLEAYMRLQMLMGTWLIRVARALRKVDERPRPMTTVDPRVAEARRLIDEAIPAEPFIERALAGRLRISPSHLDRLFVAAYGMTPRAYAHGRRVEWAQNQLTNTQAPIKQIALQLGFRHASHFTHWFRKLGDGTPLAFRRRRLPP